jgi:hypothetical protein
MAIAEGTGVAAEREALRAKHGVRLVAKDEEGTGVANLPPGVYGFTYSPGMESPIFMLEKYHSFEVHKLADETVRLIGYVTPAKLKEIESSADVIEVQVFPGPWGESNQMAVLPGNWVVGSPKAPREDGNPINFRLVAVR